jgi:hypothetical protein
MSPGSLCLILISAFFSDRDVIPALQRGFYDQKSIVLDHFKRLDGRITSNLELLQQVNGKIDVLIAQAETARIPPCNQRAKIILVRSRFNVQNLDRLLCNTFLVAVLYLMVDFVRF